MNKRYILPLLASGAIMLTQSAHALIVNNAGAFETNCPGANKSMDFYIPTASSSMTIYPYDTMSAGILSFVRDEESSVKVWKNGSNVSWCQDWRRMSNVVPGDRASYAVVSNFDWCAVSKAAKPDASKPNLQLVFGIAYREEAGINPSGATSPYEYYPMSGTSIGGKTNLPDSRSRIWNPAAPAAPRIHGNECLNINFHYCGDGATDSSQGEQCDLGSQNGQAGSSCSATCQTQTVTPVACVRGSVAVPSTTAVTASTAGLCQNGAVGGFTSAVSGNTTTYSWSCGGSAVGTANGGNCTTSFTATVTPVSCVRGSVAVPSTTAVTAATAGLCSAGAVGDFSAATSGNVTNYSWSCGGSAIGTANGGNCTTSFTATVTPVSCVRGSVAVPSTVACTASTAGLCAAGAVGDFSATTSGNVTNYAWSCGGSAIGSANGGNCTTSFTSTVTPVACVRGSVAVPSGSSVSASTPGLCSAGAVGNFWSVTSGYTTSYSWSCGTSAIGNANGGNCTTSYTTSTSSTSSTGGPNPFCLRGGIPSNIDYALTLNTPGLCRLATQIPGNLTSTVVGENTIYTWTCDGVANNVWGNCRVTSTAGGTTRTYCGDGQVQRPNHDGQNEECDEGVHNGQTASICTSNCTIAWTNPGANPVGHITITAPGASEPTPIESFRAIIGHGVPVFETGDSVQFMPDMPLYIDHKSACIGNRATSFIDGSTRCKTVDAGVGGDVFFARYNPAGDIVGYDKRTYPASIELFQGSEITHFVGNTSSFRNDSRITFRETIPAIFPSTQNDSFYASLQYLESPFRIRVSKSAIVSLAGGTAFIQNPVGYSVNTAVASFMDGLAQGNFVASTINRDNFGDRTLAGATATVVSNTDINQAIQSSAIGSRDSIGRMSGNAGMVGSAMTYNVYDANGLTNQGLAFGDNTNVRVFPSGDVSIDQLIRLSGTKTIIIENGDLLVNKNVEYANVDASWAFIVKNGNVRIAKDVTRLSGVIVTMNGRLMADGQYSPKQLVIEGNVYGDASDLIDKRTYVEGRSNDTSLSVGVVINYSNRVIKSTPPLLSDFLEGFKLHKVAR